MNALRCILVNPSHPGNIGAAARALKTMQLSQLALVNPEQYPDPVATARAAGGVDVLSNAHVHDNLADAVQDCRLVIACTARRRRLSLTPYSPREAAEALINVIQQDQPAALLFGNERNGLDNSALDYAHGQVTIPTNPDYSSLNLAAAVQIMVYECFSAFERQSDGPAKQLASTADEMQALYDHMQTSFSQIGFINPNNPRYTLRRLKRLFNRAQLSKSDIAMLRGLCSCIDKASKET